MKIVLIDPPGWGLGLNIGLGYIAAIVPDHNVQVIDLNNYRGSADRRLQKALVGADIVGVSIFTSHNVGEVADILFRCRGISNAMILIGGIGATLKGKDLLKQHLCDVIVKGEGERTFRQIVDGKSFDLIDGIIYREGKKIIENKDREFVDLNILPFPDYEVFDHIPTLNLGFYDMMTSRGCPYNCVFCLNKLISKRKFRARSPENVAAEIEHVIKTYKIRRFQIQDDNFILDPERAEKICELIAYLDVKLYLNGGVRADRLTPSLAKKLKMAGCKFAMVGIENGDEDTFSKVGKGESLEDIKNAVNLLKSNGITAKGTTVIGLIDTTYESDMRSVRFTRSLGIDSTWHYAYPYEGTELYRWVEANGRFLNGNSLDNLWPIAFETDEYTAKEREIAFTIACVINHQYARPLSGFTPFKISDLKRLADVLDIVWMYDKRHVLPLIYDLTIDTVKRFIYRVFLPFLPKSIYPFILRAYEHLRGYMNKYA